MCGGGLCPPFISHTKKLPWRKEECLSCYVCGLVQIEGRSWRKIVSLSVTAQLIGAESISHDRQACNKLRLSYAPPLGKILFWFLSTPYSKAIPSRYSRTICSVLLRSRSKDTGGVNAPNIWLCRFINLTQVPQSKQKLFPYLRLSKHLWTASASHDLGKGSYPLTLYRDLTAKSKYH